MQTGGQYIRTASPAFLGFWRGHWNEDHAPRKRVRERWPSGCRTRPLGPPFHRCDVSKVGSRGAVRTSLESVQLSYAAILCCSLWSVAKGDVVPPVAHLPIVLLTMCNATSQVSNIYSLERSNACLSIGLVLRSCE